MAQDNTDDIAGSVIAGSVIAGTRGLGHAGVVELAPQTGKQQSRGVAGLVTDGVVRDGDGVLAGHAGVRRASQRRRSRRRPRGTAELPACEWAVLNEFIQRQVAAHNPLARLGFPEQMGAEGTAGGRLDALRRHT